MSVQSPQIFFGRLTIKTRLDAYCNKNDIAKSQLIKALLTRYLNEQEDKDEK